MVIGSLAGTIFFNGAVQLLFAAVTGVAVTIVAFGWAIGGDVFSLPWLWGALGEQWTAELLDELDGSWHAEHDIPRERGNWDHVLVGPAGVFLLDTKRLSGKARVARDALMSGRLRHPGAGFRAAAATLGEELEQRLGWRPWVQAVVVIWGDFPERVRQEDRVVYIRREELLAWLQAQPRRLSESRRTSAKAAVSTLREAATAAATDA